MNCQATAILLIASSIVVNLIVDISAAEDAIRFNRDVRPILAAKCYRCHGPDAAAREAELRLDERSNATLHRDGYQVIRPNAASKSRLVQRIMTDDTDHRMPPADSGLKLSQAEIDLLRRWIDNGAKYESHWSFTAPANVVVPKSQSAHSDNAIDRFIHERLEREGLTASQAASLATMIRRATFDLTGLPPTLEEVDRFEEESRVDAEWAYQRLLDRLLASPRFGEHMAVHWLDAARYADTNGYFTDNDRTMWPWRDWVINAFNANMPFDQLTIEQLAGDLLPNATMNQLIATGFNRNHMVNNETGIIEEEFRVEYVADRVDTTATVWMGLTLGCARCHDHKYDPISQKEFYQFFSFFNNLPERGLSGSAGNSAPLLRVPSVEEQARLNDMQRQLALAQNEFAAIQKKLDESQAKWEAWISDNLPAKFETGLVKHFPLESIAAPNIVSNAKASDGFIGKAVLFNGDGCLEYKDVPSFEKNRPFSFGAWVQPAGAGCVISKMDDANEMRGFDITIRKGRVIVNLVHQWNRNAIRVESVDKIPNGQWQHIFVTYDAIGEARGIKLFVDGKPRSLSLRIDSLTGSIANNEPLRIGRRQASASFKGMVDEVRLFNRRLSPAEVFQLASRELILGITSRPAKNRSKTQQQKLRSWFLNNIADQTAVAAHQKVEKLRKSLAELSKNLPTTMIMKEADKRRPTFVLLRGQYDAPGDAVNSDVPAFLRSESVIVDQNRLALARWLVDPQHPLTARVAVNRIWQQLFGTGIVKTLDDFGTQGEWPSHPALLDWLAMEYTRSGWDTKQLLRVILSSATYRQSSHASWKNRASDAENRLLARGPQVRLSAEQLRDNALAISGLLAERIGGPSGKPYQPEGLWEAVTYDGDTPYQQDIGEKLYRRSLYSFWKRQAPPPNMLVFDAPTRETCTVQRSRTNTPLQALVLMNDPTFVEAARKFAERIMQEGGPSIHSQIQFAFRVATSRRPTKDETAVLQRMFEAQYESFRESLKDVHRLLTVGNSRVDKSLDKTTLATWAVIANTLLSLDETISH